MSASLDFETQLHTIPIRNEKLTFSQPDGNSDVLVVEVELLYRGLTGWLARILKSRTRKRYELVGVSRELFETLDGKQTVENLIDWLCEQDQLTFLEGRALILQYLRDLMRRGLIVIVPAETDAQ